MLKQLHKRLIQPVLEAHDSPEAVAGGIAIGIGLAMTPTVGIQMPLAWLLATLCGANRVVAIALVWISNPLTVVPLYYLEYMLGSRLLARDSVTSYQEFQALWASMADLAYLERIRALSDALLLPLVIGSACPAVFLGATSYPASLWWVRRRRARATSKVAGPTTEAAAGDSSEAAVEPVEPSPGLPVDVDPNTARVGALLLVGLLPVLSGCLDRRSTVAPVGPSPAVSLKDQQCAVWVGAADQGPTVLMGPLHPDEAHSEFTQTRLRESLSEASRRVTFVSLQVLHRLEEDRPIDFGAGPAVLELTGERGRIVSLAPSFLLEGIRDAHDRALLAALMGGDRLPGLARGQALRLLVALPEQADWQGARRVDLVLGGMRLSLQRRNLSAEEWDQLLQEPRNGSLEALLKEPEERP